MSYPRPAINQPDHDAIMSALREALGDVAFEEAWSHGTSLSLDDAVAYATRGRGTALRATPTDTTFSLFTMRSSPAGNSPRLKHSPASERLHRPVPRTLVRADQYDRTITRKDLGVPAFTLDDKDWHALAQP